PRATARRPSLPATARRVPRRIRPLLPRTRGRAHLPPTRAPALRRPTRVTARRRPTRVTARRRPTRALARRRPTRATVSLPPRASPPPLQHPRLPAMPERPDRLSHPLGRVDLNGIRLGAGSLGFGPG